MIDARGTFDLVQALQSGAEREELDRLLREPELDRMLPAVGIPRDLGLQMFRAAADPTRRNGLSELGQFVVSYLVDLVEHRSALESLVRDLGPREDELLRTAFERTRQFLPKESRLGPIRLVVVPIGYDFRTDRETVYMDPLAMLALGYDGIRDTLTHELHHVARYRLTGEALTLMRPEEERPLSNPSELFREWLTWLEAEGIADCAHNMVESDLPIFRDAIEQRRRQMAEFPSLLVEAQERLLDPRLESSAGASALEGTRVWVRNLAHPVGARMAGEILTRCGREAVADCVGRPGEFLRRYAEVARAHDLARVDPRLIAWAEGSAA